MYEFRFLREIEFLMDELAGVVRKRAEFEDDDGKLFLQYDAFEHSWTCVHRSSFLGTLRTYSGLSFEDCVVRMIRELNMLINSMLEA